MNYYTVSDKKTIVLCPIENAIFDWKLQNLVTFIDNLTFIDNNNIIFTVSINNINYNFKLENRKIWIVELLYTSNLVNNIELNILKMINDINQQYETYKDEILPNKILDIIEETIDKYEFDDDNIESDKSSIKEDSDTESESDTDSSKNGNIFENINDFEEIMKKIESDSDLNYFNDNDIEKLENIKIENEEENNDNLTDTEFISFIRELSDRDNIIIIDYNKLRNDALILIDKNSKSDNKLFQPEESINIIINEIKNIENSDDLELLIDNIYKFRIIYNSEVFEAEIIFEILLNTIEYPCSPPRINIIKPTMTNNINYLINNMNYFKLENWNPTNSLISMLREIIKIIEQYCKIYEINESYSELSNYLTELSIISKYKPKSCIDNINFQIPFININKLEKLETEWKSGTGYGNNKSSKWDIKKYLESTEYIIKKLNNIILLISNSINKLSLDEINNSCLIEFLAKTITDYNTDIIYINNNKNYINNLINLCYKVLEINKNLFDDYIKLFNDSINSIDIIYKMNVNNDIINSLYKLYNYIIIEKKIDDIKISDDLYIETLKSMQFRMISNLTNVCNTNKKLVNNIRLAREIANLSKSLPLNYESSIFIIVDESNMQNIHALIMPSHGTPYSCGCFLFHIFLPETYPKNPPLVKLITTGNGTVRFNPNLYACGKVCLSLLGTWSGDASESWNESTSTILQVLVSIQSLIFIEQPYFNEPGYEKSIDSENGKIASNSYNKSIQYNTVCFAMIDILKNPPKEFENVIKNHFKLKRDHIKKETNEWLINSTKTKDNLFNKKYQELVELLDKL